MAAVVARIRLVHPFPSFVNGLAVLGIALAAGASPTEAGRLAVSMVLLQFSIGSTNDLVDAPRDNDRVPLKPIASGLVGRSTALVVGVAAAASGLVIAATFGGTVLAIAVAGLACGLAYDVRLSRTAFSWVALAIALPLVPAFAWIGATGVLPARMAPIVPMAMLAGAGLAIGNALVDLDADQALGRRTVAVALGRSRAWATHGALLAGVVVWLVALEPLGGGAGTSMAGATVGLTAIGLGLIGAGIILLRTARGAGARIGWALEATGVASLGVGWVLAAVAVG